jgi:hypothetical protein
MKDRDCLTGFPGRLHRACRPERLPSRHRHHDRACPHLHPRRRRRRRLPSSRRRSRRRHSRPGRHRRWGRHCHRCLLTLRSRRVPGWAQGRAVRTLRALPHRPCHDRRRRSRRRRHRRPCSGRRRSPARRAHRPHQDRWTHHPHRPARHLRRPWRGGRCPDLGRHRPRRRPRPYPSRSRPGHPGHCLSRRGHQVRRSHSERRQRPPDHHCHRLGYPALRSRPARRLARQDCSDGPLGSPADRRDGGCHSIGPDSRIAPGVVVLMELTRIPLDSIVGPR